MQLGCLALLLAMSLTCIMPLLLVDAMRFALQQLGLSPAAAILVLLGILLGGLFNWPVHRIERREDQLFLNSSAWGFPQLFPRIVSVPRVTIIAVNVGGCVIPSILAVWQILRVIDHAAPQPLVALVVASLANVAVCYMVSRPVDGVGIIMPAFTSPAVAIGTTCLMLLSPEYAAWRAPVAFTAGVLGPLVGADLLHLKDITKVSVGMMSIGGAGTFDGIVLSGVGAAFVCGLLS